MSDETQRPDKRPHAPRANAGPEQPVSYALTGHTAAVNAVAITPDGSRAVSASLDDTLRVWDLAAQEKKFYTNAKVLLVGESGVGKTGLAQRLTQGKFEATVSTDGHQAMQLPPEAWATQLPLLGEHGDAQTEREIWLWDFAGQSDYRLIHQLFLDETALAVLVFNPQNPDALTGLGEWDKDLEKAKRRDKLRKILVAGRCDVGGLVISREYLQKFMAERGFSDFIETSAKENTGCAELVEAIKQHIP
jgi:small GTP-binding protein